MNATQDHQAEQEHTVLFVGETPVTAGEIRREFDTDSATVTVVRDGRRAIGWLTDTSGPESEERPPDTVFLTAGLETPAWPTLLHALKSSPRLGPMPVVVLTDDETDAQTAYALGGNAHVTVPESPGAYRRCLGAISEFWVGRIRHPSEYLYGRQA